MPAAWSLMRWSAFTVIIGLLSGCATTRNIVAQVPPLTPPSGPPRQWSFDRTPPAGLQADWELAETHGGSVPGVWTIVADDEAPSKPSVLRLVANSALDTYNLCVLKVVRCDDLDLTVKLRADGGSWDQGGGLVWHYQDSSNYYVVRVNPLEHNFVAYRVVDGARTELVGVRCAAAKGRWLTLRVVQLGDRVDCYLDGQRLIAIQDGTLPNAGRVGVWTKCDASSSFDDFVVTAVPPRK